MLERGVIVAATFQIFTHFLDAFYFFPDGRIHMPVPPFYL